MPDQRLVESTNAPAAIGPYSQAVIAQGMVFTAGVIPLDPETMEVVEGGIEAQSERVMKSLSALLDDAGSSLGRVVKTTCFLQDLGDFATFNTVYAGRGVPSVGIDERHAPRVVPAVLHGAQRAEHHAIDRRRRPDVPEDSTHGRSPSPVSDRQGLPAPREGRTAPLARRTIASALHVIDRRGTGEAKGGADDRSSAGTSRRVCPAIAARVCPPCHDRAVPGSHPPKSSIGFHLVDSGSCPSPGAMNTAASLAAALARRGHIVIVRTRRRKVVRGVAGGGHLAANRRRLLPSHPADRYPNASSM